MNTQDERKAFEDWAKKASNGFASFTRFPDGNYATDKLNFAWAAWQESNKKLQGCVVVPVEPTNEWMANYIDSGVENYCEEFIGQKFAVKEHEKPFIKEEWRGPVRKAHALILKVVEAARGGNE